MHNDQVPLIITGYAQASGHFWWKHLWLLFLLLVIGFDSCEEIICLFSNKSYLNTKFRSISQSVTTQIIERKPKVWTHPSAQPPAQRHSQI